MTATLTKPQQRTAILAALLAMRRRIEAVQEAWQAFVAAVVEDAGQLPEDRQGTEWIKAQFALLTAVRNRADALRRDTAALITIAVLDAAQGSADREAAAEDEAGLPSDPGLQPTLSHSVTLSTGAALLVAYSVAASRAAQATTERVYPDGLRLYDRLANLDASVRGVVDHVIADGIAKGLPAAQIAVNLQYALAAEGVETPLYKAMRLAVTETAMAAREASIQSAVGSDGRLKDGVIGLRWTLSASHEIEDACDSYAAGSSDGLPAGVYLPEDVPETHPNCRCQLSPVFAGES